MGTTGRREGMRDGAGLIHIISFLRPENKPEEYKNDKATKGQNVHKHSAI